MTDRPFALPASPDVMFRQAEAELLRRRGIPPDMHASVAEALAIVYGAAPAQHAAATGRAIADAVTAHAASFAAGCEPAYHGQRHQAEATTAMAWLCAQALRLGLLDADTAACGVLAMAGHDLLHDGTWPGAGILEARSAAATLALAAQAGLSEAAMAVIRRVILATDTLRPPAAFAADDLLCRMAQEADVFGSLTPGLGWQLSEALAQEAEVAGVRFDPPLASFSGRLLLLRRQRPATPPAGVFGLGDAVAGQIAAMATFASGDAERGAATLDARPLAEAQAAYAAALTAA